MSDKRIQPTEEMECTNACPSYNLVTKMCAVTGHKPHPAESSSELSGTPSSCSAAIHAVMDAYEAERKARRAKAPLQDYRVVADTNAELFLHAVRSAQLARRLNEKIGTVTVPVEVDKTD